MFEHREQDDALGVTLDELLHDCRVLCFDEFHVHDIGDAMLITRLFKALFQRGIVLLVTSNYPPEGLLPNPLYHARFKPVIDLINARMHVMEVGGPHDYRSQASNHAHQIFTQGHYVWPATATQRLALNLPPEDAPAMALPVGSRHIQARLCEARRVAFSFNDLCEQPTAVMDYLELCRRFDQWIIDDLPELDERSIAAQQRFINLIDVLYDQDKHLTLLSRLPLRETLSGNAIDLARTAAVWGSCRKSTDPINHHRLPLWERACSRKRSVSDESLTDRTPSRASSLPQWIRVFFSANPGFAVIMSPIPSAWRFFI